MKIVKGSGVTESPEPVTPELFGVVSAFSNLEVAMCLPTAIAMSLEELKDLKKLKKS